MSAVGPVTLPDDEAALAKMEAAILAGFADGVLIRICALVEGTPAEFARDLRSVADAEALELFTRPASPDELRAVAAHLDATRSELLALIPQEPTT